MSECQTKAGNQAHSLTQSLSTCWTTFVFMAMLKSHILTLSHSQNSLSHTLTSSHSFTLSFTHSWHAEQVLFSSLCSKVTLTLSCSHSHTLSLSHSHTLSISHSLTLDMLNKFCFHLYAQISLFIGENCDVFFWPPQESGPYPVTLEFIELAPS